MLIALVSLGLVLGQVPTPPPTIGWAEIQRAKALLAEAKGELAPKQYELLESELIQAEGAFQHFSTLAKAAGEAAEVARGAEALTGAQRVSQLTEGLGALSRVGPLLVALAILWPASTATQAQERPPAYVARIDLEASLQQLATSSQKVAGELKAAKRPKGSEKCGSCRCFYRGIGPEVGPQQPTRADCRKYCTRTTDGHVPSNGMQCTGDKAVEWWK